MPNPLELEFHKEMINIYLRAKNEANYVANRFIKMVTDHGGLETAKILINADTPSDGYTALYLKGRLDLTVEAIVQDPKWAFLFDPEEIKRSRERLVEYGFKVI
jgi:hypothetical protein